MRFVEILYSLPFVFLVIVLVVFFGRNFILIFVAIGAIEWLDMARIVRGQTLSLKQKEFIEAGMKSGAFPGAGVMAIRHGKMFLNHYCGTFMAGGKTTAVAMYWMGPVRAISNRFRPVRRSSRARSSRPSSA